MSTDRIEDLEQPNAGDIKGGGGEDDVTIRVNDTTATANASLSGVDAQVGQISADVSRGEGGTHVNVKTRD